MRLSEIRNQRDVRACPQSNFLTQDGSAAGFTHLPHAEVLNSKRLDSPSSKRRPAPRTMSAARTCGPPGDQRSSAIAPINDTTTIATLSQRGAGRSVGRSSLVVWRGPMIFMRVRPTVGRSAASRASEASGPSECEGGESAATPCWARASLQTADQNNDCEQNDEAAADHRVLQHDLSRKLARTTRISRRRAVPPSVEIVQPGGGSIAARISIAKKTDPCDCDSDQFGPDECCPCQPSRKVGVRAALCPPERHRNGYQCGEAEQPKTFGTHLQGRAQHVIRLPNWRRLSPHPAQSRNHRRTARTVAHLSRQPRADGMAEEMVRGCWAANGAAEYPMNP